MDLKRHSTLKSCGNLDFLDSWRFAWSSLEPLKLTKKKKLIGREKYCQSFKLFDSRMMFALDQLAMEPASLRKAFPKIRDISFHKIYLIYYFNFREECSSRSGTNEGSCASGFGVCCVREYFQRTKCEIPERHKTWFFIILVTLSCGESSSENNTYIVQSSTTTAPATPCTYKICPCSTDICRIRYDFTTNVLANQVTSSADAASGTAPDLTTS